MMRGDGIWLASGRVVTEDGEITDMVDKRTVLTNADMAKVLWRFVTVMLIIGWLFDAPRYVELYALGCVLSFALAVVVLIRLKGRPR